MAQRNHEGYCGGATCAAGAKRWEWLRCWKRYLIPVLLVFVATGWSLEAQAAEPFNVCVNPAGLMKVVSSPDECGKNETHHNLSPDATPEFLALQSRVESLEIQVASLQEEVAALSDALGHALPPKVFLPEGFSVLEGTETHSDPGNYTWVDLQITMSKPAPYPVYVMISDGNWTNQAYFHLGATTDSLSYPVARDAIPEADEEITLSIINTNVDIGLGETVLIVENDDYPSVVSRSRYFPASEGSHERSCAYLETYAVPEAWDEIMTVDYFTEAQTAEAGSDFVHTEGTLVIPKEGGILCAEVPLIDDDEVEPREQFLIYFSNPVNVVLSGYNPSVTYIYDQDLTFEVADMTVEEGNTGDSPYTWLTVEIVLSAPAPSNQYFNVWPRRLDPEEAIVGDPSDGTYDVKYSSVSVAIGEGATSGTVSIAIYGDTLPEVDEGFRVRVVNSSGGALAPDGSTYLDANALILNDD